MVYKLVPQASDLISQSQIDFLENNRVIYNTWGKTDDDGKNIGDHVLLDKGATVVGKHKKLTMVEESADPAPAANECALYTKDSNSITELYYQRNGDANGFKLTDQGGLSVGGLVLRAWVCFSLSGKIIKVSRKVNGQSVKVPASFNVSSVDKVTDDEAEWIINFETDLPTDKYIWSFNAFFPSFAEIALAGLTLRVPVAVQAKQAAAYATSITESKFHGIGVPFFSGQGSTAAENVPTRMMFQAYTVAS